MNLSGFLTIHPDLVLLTLFSCNESLFAHILTILLSWLMPSFLLYCSMFASFWTPLLVFCSSYWSHVLFMVITHSVVYIAGFLLILFSISVSGSVVLLDSLLDWCCRYVSAVTVVGFMCCLFLEMHLPLFVSWITYDLPWWLWLPLPTTVQWVHGPPSSCWTATAHPVGIFENTGEVSLSFFFCLSTNLMWWSSLQSCPIGFQSTTGIMPWTCLLNIIVIGLGSPWPIGIVCKCNSTMFLSLPDSVHFLNVCIINLMQALTCPLLWWWHVDDTACSMLIDLQKCLNFSETKFVPASDILFCGILYSANIAVTAMMRCSTDSPCSFLMIGNLLLQSMRQR